MLQRIPWDQAPISDELKTEAASLTKYLSSGTQSGDEWRKLITRVTKLVPKGPWKHLLSQIRKQIPDTITSTDTTELSESWEKLVAAVEQDVPDPVPDKPLKTQAKIVKTTTAGKTPHQKTIRDLVAIIKKYQPAGTK